LHFGRLFYDSPAISRVVVGAWLRCEEDVAGSEAGPRSPLPLCSCPERREPSAPGGGCQCNIGSYLLFFDHDDHGKQCS